MSLETMVSLVTDPAKSSRVTNKLVALPYVSAADACTTLTCMLCMGGPNGRSQEDSEAIRAKVLAAGVLQAAGRAVKSANVTVKENGFLLFGVFAPFDPLGAAREGAHHAALASLMEIRTYHTTSGEERRIDGVSDILAPAEVVKSVAKGAMLLDIVAAICAKAESGLDKETRANLATQAAVIASSLGTLIPHMGANATPMVTALLKSRIATCGQILRAVAANGGEPVLITQSVGKDATLFVAVHNSAIPKIFQTSVLITNWSVSVADVNDSCMSTPPVKLALPQGKVTTQPPAEQVIPAAKVMNPLYFVGAPAPAGVDASFFDGKEVVLDGFKERTDLNGLTATATKSAQTPGKCAVRVDKTGETLLVGVERLQVKKLMKDDDDAAASPAPPPVAPPA